MLLKVFRAYMRNDEKNNLKNQFSHCKNNRFEIENQKSQKNEKTLLRKYIFKKNV